MKIYIVFDDRGRDSDRGPPQNRDDSMFADYKSAESYVSWAFGSKHCKELIHEREVMENWEVPK